MEPLKIEHDVVNDVVIVDGFKYSAAIFRSMHEIAPPGYWIRTVKSENGVVIVQQLHESQIAEMHSRSLKEGDTHATTSST